MKAGTLGAGIAVIAFSIQALPMQMPSFEVASVKQNNDGSIRPALRYTPSGVDFAGVPITWIIGEAYDLPYYSPNAILPANNAVSELLSPTNRFDVSARAESAVSRSVVRLMLRSLLIERFKLTLHQETKEESVYRLVVASSGPKLRAAPDQSEAGQPVISNSSAVYDFRHVDMGRLAGFLSTLLGQRVLNATGLDGFYDFALNREEAPALEREGDPRDKSAIARGAVSSAIPAGMERQLGLKLESARASVDHVVIDHLEKPSEN